MQPENENFPSALEACFLIILLMGLELLFSSLIDSMQSVTGMEAAQLDGVVTVLANAVLFTVLLQYKRLSYGKLFHASGNRVSVTICLLALPLLLVLPALELSMGLITTFIENWIPVSATQQREFDEMMGGSGGSVITACLIAPVLEEMLFRGIILRSFLNQYSRWRAILGSSLLFGLAHMNVYQFVSAGIIGVVCAWLYDRTRSLWPGIFLHMSSNMFVLYLYQSMSNREVQTDWEASDWLLLFLVLMLAMAGIWLLRRLLLPGRTSANQ